MQQEGSFLLGALAGMMTKSNSSGCVGGKAYPNIINIFEGFKQGAKLVNPNVKITCVYIDTFQDPAKGKEAGLSLINNGADFLIHVADLSGYGVIQAADEFSRTPIWVQYIFASAQSDVMSRTKN